MRSLPVYLILACLVSLASVRASDVSGQAQTAPSAAHVVLDQMGQAERANSRISVEFASSDSGAIVQGRQVERLWNDGLYEDALVQLGNLEARVGRVAIGNSWRKPVPTLETNLWGRDVRIGNRDSIQQLVFVADSFTNNLFAVLRHSATPPHYSVCMSANGGGTWSETFTWSGSSPKAIGAAVLANHVYVVYNSPEENAEQIRMRRFRCSNGSADTFRNGGYSVIPCTLAVGDTMKEVSLVSNPDNNWLHIVALVSDGSLLVSVGNANAVSWKQRPTGITSGARSGPDAADAHWSDRDEVFFSYYDVSDTLRICGGAGDPLTMPAGSGTTTSISAYLDTVICVYEDGSSSPHQIRYALSYDGGETGFGGTLSDSGSAAEAPAVTVLGGGAVVFRQDSTTPELRFRQRTDSGSWSEPVSIADHAPASSRPGIAYLGAGVFGVVYLSDTSPVVHGAYFDRSDWVYGIAEQHQPPASSLKPQATIVHGVLRLKESTSSSASCLLDIGGRKIMELHAGANDVSRLAPGVYFIRAEADGRALTVPVTVVR
jgi:hypothetical protein